MKWSWKIGQLDGVDLRIHSTFLLLLGWVWASYAISGHSLVGMAFIAAFFASVALHEFGHLIVARRLGIRTRDITLLPIGGVSRLERIPDEPRHELWAALAGPAVSVAIAGILYVWPAHPRGPFVESLFLANLSLALFNLLPAFPMDGGRVLRALLAGRVAYSKVTQIAASTGQGLALALAFVGLFTNPVLVFIGWFVWIGASQEAAAGQIRSALSGIPARAAMLTDFQELWCKDTLADAVRLALQGSQHDFPVVEHGFVKGVLTRNDLLVALAAHGQDYPVSAVMRREFMVAEGTEMLGLVLQRLRWCNCHTMPVLQDGRLTGLITMDQLGEYFLCEAARGPGRESDFAHLPDLSISLGPKSNL
jgi:Zn-dependent protease